MERPRIIALSNDSAWLKAAKHLLFDSGEYFHISAAESGDDLATLLAGPGPLAVLAGDDCAQVCDPERLADLLDEHGVPLLLLASGAASEAIGELLGAGICPQLCPADSDALGPLLASVASRARLHSDHEALRHRLTVAESLHDALLDVLEDAVAYLHEGLHVHANASYIERLGLTVPDELEGLSLLDVMQGVDQDLRSLLRQVADGTPVDHAVAVEVLNRDGRSMRGELRLSTAAFRGEECLRVVLREENPQARIAMELRDLRERDPLTGALRRTVFMDRLGAYIEQAPRETRYAAVLCIRPTGIRDLQEEHGLRKADRYLEDFAVSLRGCLMKTDALARWSEDRFLALVERDDDTVVERLAKRMIDAADAVGDEHDAPQGCHIGITPLVTPSISAGELMRHARSACEQAAAEGQPIAWYRPRLSMVERADGAADAWGARLRHALEHGGFFCVQQTVADLEGGDGQLVENRSFIRSGEEDFDQDEFLAQAHSRRIGAEVDRALLPDLLAIMAREPPGQRHLVGISTCSVLDEGFSAWLDGRLEATGLTGDRLIVQFPIEAAIEYRARVRAFVDGLRGMNCHFAMHGATDDERHWKLACSLRPALLRLASVTVDGLPEREETRRLLKERSRMAQEHGIDIVAGGVLDAPHLAALWQSGVRWVVGDYLQDAPQVVGQ